MTIDGIELWLEFRTRFDAIPGSRLSSGRAVIEMLFKPFPILTLIAIPALALLIGLGVWQLQRAEWKADLIADFERSKTEAPIHSLSQALCDSGDRSRPISGAVVVGGALASWPPAGAAFRMYGQDASGAAGWRHLVVSTPPACIDDKGRILIEGPFERFIPGGRQALIDPGPEPAHYTIANWPEKPMFALDNSPPKNDWHWFDAKAMADYLDVPINREFYLAIMPGELPAHLARTPPGTHIGYAVTWFGMAIAFVVIYALFHARAGRLRFRKRA
jgi:surfeit locus 1 family protein